LVSEPELVFLSVLQASADIDAAFVVLVPVSAVVVEVGSSERPKFLAFPNGDHCASPSSSVEAARKESFHSPTGARTKYGLCSILSNPDLHQNKNLVHCYNIPSHGHNTVSDTNDLPMDATKNHSRRKGLHLPQGQRKRHSRQELRSHLVVRQLRWVVAEEQ
jgi:hypothetical protein